MIKHLLDSALSNNSLPVCAWSEQPQRCALCNQHLLYVSYGLLLLILHVNTLR